MEKHGRISSEVGHLSALKWGECILLCVNTEYDLRVFCGYSMGILWVFYGYLKSFTSWLRSIYDSERSNYNRVPVLIQNGIIEVGGGYIMS